MVAKNSADISFTARLNISAMQQDLTRLGKITRSKVASINQQLAQIRAGFKVDTGGLADKDFMSKQNLVKANMQKELADKVLGANSALEQQRQVLSNLQNPAAKAKERLSLLKKETSAMFGKDFTQKAQAFSGSLDKSIPAINRFRLGIQHVKKEMQVTRQEFPAWALSVMFFGMQLVQAFRSVWMASTKTFNDVMHSVEGTITSFDRLEGATTYLKFVAGQALEPIAEALLPIIDRLSDWISANPEIFRGIMTVVGVLGVALTTIGLLALNVNAVSGAFVALKTTIMTIGPAIMKIVAAVGAIKLALIALGIAAIIAMWQTNFAGFRDYVKALFGGMWETIKSVFVNVLAVVKNVFGLVKNIMTGDFEAASENLKEIGKNLAAILIKIFLGIGAALANTFIFAINSIKTAFSRLIEFQLYRLESVAEAWDDMFGTDLASRVSNMRSALNKLNEDSNVSYISTEEISAALSKVNGLVGLEDKTTPQGNSSNMSVYNDNKEVNMSIYQLPGEDSTSFADNVSSQLRSNFTQ